MRQLLCLLRKEFQQLRRDPAMLRMVIFIPLIQALLFSYAVNTDLKQLRTIIVDLDDTPESRDLRATWFATGYFVPAARQAATYTAAQALLAAGKADVIVAIPRGFARDLERSAQIGMIIDGQNSNVAALARGYAQRLVGEYNRHRMMARKQAGRLPAGADAEIAPVMQVWYNPELNIKYFMVPGIVVLLITILSAFLSGIAIVKEKEIGTIELLLVAPLARWQLVAGKLIPFFLLAFVNMLIVLAFAQLWFAIPFTGSALTLTVGVALYLLTTLGVGLFASTVSATQMQAMFSVWFFLIFAIMTSGFFFPVENMPQWLQMLTLLNPMRYMMDIMRAVVLKGASFRHLTPSLAALAALGTATFLLAVARFRRQLG